LTAACQSDLLAGKRSVGILTGVPAGKKEAAGGKFGVAKNDLALVRDLLGHEPRGKTRGRKENCSPWSSAMHPAGETPCARE